MNWKFVLVCGLFCIPALAAADDAVMQFSISTATYPQQNMLVRIVTQYPSEEQDVEYKFQEALADRQVDSDSFAEIFPSSTTPSKMLRTMKKNEYTTYLCVWPRRMVQWDPSMAAPPQSNPLLIFLGRDLTYSVSKDTSGKNPTSRWIDPTYDEATPGNDPIQGDGGGDDINITKYNMIVFDVATGQRVWKGILKIQSSPDLRTYWYDKELKGKVLAYLTYSNLIPAP